MQSPTRSTKIARRSSGPADLLLLNARILTLDPGHPAAQAVAIQGDIICAVGSEEKVAPLAVKDTRKIDCRGMVLIPGIIDAHCHLLAMAAAQDGLDCSPPTVSSVKELLDSVRHRAGETPAGQWIRGFGYDDLAIADERFPTRWELDSAAPHHPVRIDHRSGHATVLNSRALEMAGVHRETPDPVEGVIDRAEATGEPTGLLLEMASLLRQRLGRTRGFAELEECVSGLSQTLLGHGITSVQDAGPDNGLDRWETFQRLRRSGGLHCRVTMLAGISHLPEFQSRGMGWGHGDDWLRLGHAKVMLTLTTGELHPSMAALRETILEAHRVGFPVAIHAVEREAVSAAAQVLQKIPPTPLFKGGQGGISNASEPLENGPSPRDRIEHCAECPPDLVAEVRRTGAMVVTQPGFIYWNGEIYRERVDPSLLPYLYPVGVLDWAGVPLAFGSDAPVTVPNPWPAVYSAVTRATKDGKSLGSGDRLRSGPNQKISLDRALRIYILGGARAEGTERRKGAVVEGNLADLVLLDADPMAVHAERLKDIRAVLTLVGGRVVWEKGF